jgi:hypothetical protein
MGVRTLLYHQKGWLGSLGQRDIQKNLDVSYTKANKLRSLAEELEIVSQISAGTRNRKYSYHTYISILSEGTEMVEQS